MPGATTLFQRADRVLADTPEKSAKGLGNVIFESWLLYEQLPDRIHQADVLLGVLGTTPKAGRVIFNKVFQSLARGRVVVTRSAGAYPEALIAAESSGLHLWTDALKAGLKCQRTDELFTIVRS